MITGMISKLEAEAEAAATKKAYCDVAMQETTAKKKDTSDEIEGLKGIRLTLTVLEECYAKGSAHGFSEGSAGCIIELEVCEAGFSKNLAEITSEGETADAEHDEVTKGNQIEKASMTTRVEELTGSLSTNEADLKAATEVRAKELADFDAQGAKKADAIEDLATKLEQATAKSGHRGQGSLRMRAQCSWGRSAGSRRRRSLATEARAV